MEGDAQAKKHCTTGEAVGVALQMNAKRLILTHFSQRYQKIPVLSSVKMPDNTTDDDLIDEVDPEMTADMGVAGDDGSLSAERVVAQSETPAWTEPSTTKDLPIAIAFDLMRIRVSQIEHMKKFFPAISKMFELEDEKQEKERLERAARVIEEDRKKLEVKEANRAKRVAKNLEMQKAQAKEQTGKKKKVKGGRPQNANKDEQEQPSESKSIHNEDLVANGSSHHVNMDLGRQKAPDAAEAGENRINHGENHALDVSTKRAQASDDVRSQPATQSQALHTEVTVNLQDSGVDNGYSSPVKRQRTE
jgi:RNase P/RNase MRP subunit p29